MMSWRSVTWAFPAEFALDFGGVGEEAGRVACAAWVLDNLEVLAGNFADGLDDLADGVALADAEVVSTAVAWLESVHDLGVGVGEVFDVDVIADAGAVGGWVVGAEE
jgi:hypothetical protein